MLEIAQAGEDTQVASNDVPAAIQSLGIAQVQAVERAQSADGGGNGSVQSLVNQRSVTEQETFIHTIKQPLLVNSW